MGGWSRNGISQGNRTNVQGSTYRMPAPPPTPQAAASAAGAMPFELPPQYFKKLWADWRKWDIPGN
jgi:hypothetical protein